MGSRSSVSSTASPPSYTLSPKLPGSLMKRSVPDSPSDLTGNSAGVTRDHPTSEGGWIGVGVVAAAGVVDRVVVHGFEVFASGGRDPDDAVGAFLDAPVGLVFQVMVPLTGRLQVLGDGAGRA